MKKLSTLIVSLVLCVTLVACGSEKEAKTEDSVGFGNPEILDVLSGSGDKIGERIAFSFNKAEFQSISYDDIKAFMDDKLEGYKEDGYNYCSIVFDDGTGICFSGCSPILAAYGTIDGDGMVTESKGFLEDKDTYFTIIDDAKTPLSDATEPNGINGI